MDLTEAAFNDPVSFAQWAFDAYLVPAYEVDAQRLSPTEEEIERWMISARDLVLCRCEFPLMAATGLAVTVAKNLPFEYYKTFTDALCGRLIRMLYGHFAAAFVKDAKDTLELYIIELESKDIELFAARYTGRVFPNSPHSNDILEAQLWQRAMDVMLHSMQASREAMIKLLAARS